MANLSLRKIAELCKVADYLESDRKTAKLELQFTGKQACVIRKFQSDAIRADDKRMRRIARALKQIEKGKDKTK